MYPLIGLTGHKAAGKDSVARILVDEYGYTRRAFADALKNEVVERILGDQKAASPFQYILLTKGKVTLVDTADYAQLSLQNWCYSVRGYAIRGERRNGKNIIIPMHREIMQPQPHEFVDHRNGDRLDNRRVNLRLCRHVDNSRNRQLSRLGRCGYRGVVWHKQAKLFQAQITVNYRHIGLGYFKTAEEAAIAYDHAAKAFFGEFAVLNDIPQKKEQEIKHKEILSHLEEHKHDPPDSPHGWPRLLLQAWGQMRRDLCGADYWLQQIVLDPGIVVSDVRYANEADAIRAHGGLLWRIVRPGYNGDAHASEVEVDGLPVSRTIHNTGSLDDLRVKVRLALLDARAEAKELV